jgi:aryl-alcohol dehydrogenase-like predicted oxidoreductase
MLAGEPAGAAAANCNYRAEFFDSLKEHAWKILDTIAPIAKAHGCGPARISLAWLLTRPAVTSVIVGAKRLDQLQDNLAAADLTLTKEEIEELNEVSALPPEFPGWVSRFADPGRV